MKSNKSFLTKMSESSILAAYSHYLQQAILTIDQAKLVELQEKASLVLSYDEFKEYYIYGLVGKDTYIDELVREMQFAS